MFRHQHTSLRTTSSRFLAVRHGTAAAGMLVALAGALAAQPAAAQCPIAFGAPTTTLGPVAAVGGRISTGDFNSDGLADVVYISSQQGAAVFLRSNTNAFAPPVVYPGGPSPRTTKVADLDQDGVTDVIVVSVTQGATWLRGVAGSNGGGAGTFNPGSFLLLGSIVLGLDVRDLNGDGINDIASAAVTGTIRAAMGGQWPQIASMQQYFGGEGLVDAAIGDFNADGRADIAVLHPNYVRILPGVPATASGDTFGTPVDFPVPADPRHLAVADLNGDGREDIVVASATGSSLSVYFGRAGAGMAQAATAYGIAGGATDVTIADLNLDGKLDLVAACPSAGVVCVLEGMGGNLFRTYRSVSAGATPVSVCVGDADGSGYPDLLVLNESPTGITVIPNSAASPTILSQPVGQSVTSGASASFQVATAAGAPLSFQWRRNGEPMVDDGRISGATSGRLTLSPALLSDTGAAFDCVVTGPCETVVSFPAGIVVSQACSSDFNHDGEINPDDLGDFINVYFSGCP